MSEPLILGTKFSGGYEEPLTLSAADRRQHLYVIGKSGTGKSTLLRNLILQDIEAGRGVGLIDPHGDLALDVLDNIPRGRIEDVVYFDPADTDFPVGLNLLGSVPRAKRPLVASGIVEAFKGIWSESWGPRLEYFLYCSVAALLECENVSLLGLPRMLADGAYREWVVRQIKDPMVRAFWTDEFAAYDRKFIQEAVSPIRNKVGQFLMAPELRNVLAQVKSKIDARFMMDRRKIFIANLSKGKIGEEKTNLLGALLVTKFHLAAMSRADVPEEKRREFALYVDEFHSFVSDSFAAALSESRKYGLSISIAHQYLGQLRPGILRAVLGNVGSLVSFRVGHEDAEALEAAFGRSFAAKEFSSLSNGEIFAKLLCGGRDTEAVFARTHRKAGRKRGFGGKIRLRSREKYGTRREIMERRVRSWFSGRGLG